MFVSMRLRHLAISCLWGVVLVRNTPDFFLMSPFPASLFLQLSVSFPFAKDLALCCLLPIFYFALWFICDWASHVREAMKYLRLRIRGSGSQESSAHQNAMTPYLTEGRQRWPRWHGPCPLSQGRM